MSTSNISFVGIATMAVFVALLAVEVSQGALSDITGRCDGRREQVEDLKISSCSNHTEEDYCEIEINSSPELEMTFTPARDYDERIEFTIRGPTNGRIQTGQASYDPCEWGAICPLKAGRTEKIALKIRDVFTVQTTGTFTLDIHPTASPKNSIYCVDFAGKIV